MAKRLLTYDELADQLDVKPSTIKTWVRAGKIPGVRITAKIIRFDLEDVVKALKCCADESGQRRPRSAAK